MLLLYTFKEIAVTLQKKVKAFSKRFFLKLKANLRDLREGLD